LARGGRESAPLGVAIFDLDRFKSINDQHGHLAGDAVLHEAARRIQSSMRQYDAIGRYGGEEFVILLPGCDEINSLNQAERLRKALSNPEMRINDVALTVTASFGVTTAPCGYVHTPENLIRRADEALYLAKKMGRNRVEFLAYDGGAVASDHPAEQESVAQ
jgi:diguanylate cyclase (GGDEF)-like protein